jgi:hypothetical protein
VTSPRELTAAPSSASQRVGLWPVPIALLGGIARVVFASLYALDHHATDGISDLR